MHKLTYKEAGVDIEAGYEVVKRVKKLSKNKGIGGFGGAFALNALGSKETLLVSGIDGVGTKLKLAIQMDKHDTIGIDLVAMNVDDVVACGAKPLFFLDYIACHKVVPDVIEEILKGIVKGCDLAGCVLVGGETAEMSDFYQQGEYDLAGVAVGAVDKKKHINGSKIAVGDQVIGLASSGLHSNGYTLARKILERAKVELKDKIDGLKCSIGDELLKPTKIYTKTILRLVNKFNIKAISHITGGGLPENISRLLPKGISVTIDKSSWEPLPIFKIMQRLGGVEESEMYKVFNMGIGMAVIVPAGQAVLVLKYLKQQKEKAYVIGEVVKGKQEVCLK